jgi:valyl-tRNA synthetase
VAKVSMRTEVDRAVFRGPEDRLMLLRRALDDLSAAGRITGEVVFEASADGDITVEATLAG